MPISIGLLALAVLVALAFVYLPGSKARLEGIFRVPPAEAIDFITVKKTAKPNQYLVCPAGICAGTPDIVTKIYPVPADKLAMIWQNTVLAEPDVVQRVRNETIFKIDYIQRTPQMRYPDVITVQFFERPEGKSTIAIYSRSVYGYSDRGVNKARITSWLAKLDKAF